MRTTNATKYRAKKKKNVFYRSILLCLGVGIVGIYQIK